MAVSEGTRPNRRIADDEVTEPKLADGSVALAKHEDVAAGRVIGQTIDGVTGPPVHLTPLEQGENLRRDTVQSFNVTPAGGAGTGGEYTNANLVLNAETTVAVFTAQANGDIVIAGIGSNNRNGHEVLCVFNNSTFPGARLVLPSNNAQASTNFRLITANAPESGSLNTDIHISGRFSTFKILNINAIGRFWFVHDICNGAFVHRSFTAALDVLISDGNEFHHRRLVPNDINSPVLHVQTLSDLPAAVSSAITLPDDTIVLQDGDLTFPTGTRVVFGNNTVLRGYNRGRDSWTFNTAGADAITIPANPGSIAIRDITINQTSATGDHVQCADGNADRILISDVAMVGAGGRGCDIAATVVDIRSFNLTEVSDGVTATANGIVFVIDGALITLESGATGDCVDYGSFTFLQPRLSNVSLNAPAAATHVRGAASNGNMLNSAARGDMNTVNFAGAGTDLAGITRDDLQWMMVGCEGTQNSSFEGGYSMTNNATATTINTQNVYEIVAGTTAEEVVHRMSMTADNEMTMERLQTATYIVSALVSALKSGTSSLCNFGIFRNGTLVSPPMPIDVSTRVAAVPVQVIVDLVENDTVDVRVENTENTNNITVRDLTLTIAGK